MTHPGNTYQAIHAALVRGDEIALLDLREEAPHAQGHPLFATNIPLSKLEIDIWQRIPRLGTPIVLFDGGEGLNKTALHRLQSWGYEQVQLLAGDLPGWVDAGGELFIDVNSPSKAFGELVAEHKHTPMIAPEALKAQLDAGERIRVVDARRFDEYQTMSIPTGTSVPGAELVRHASALAGDTHTPIVVNCAGRTRSIIGTQSLINAGVPNPVAALRNGTIGWTLAGQQLENGQARRHPSEAPELTAAQRARVQALADRAGVRRLSLADLPALRDDPQRTTYLFDVRSPEEFAQGTLPGFRTAPGGQLVQETDFFAAVRGARIVLADDDGIRALMTGSWLRQMNWEVWVLEGLSQADFTAPANPVVKRPPQAVSLRTSPNELVAWLKGGDTVVLDFTTSANYVKRHIPSARYALRTDLPRILPSLVGARRLVLTCGSSLLAGYVAGDLQALTDQPVYVLEGGTQAWIDAGLPLETGETALLSPRIDRYRRPYEGTDNPVAAMQAYLDWEYGLVAQLAKDASHGFFVL
jgi:rhodanese-related sulfurtransferase